jgi:hypothetical protein
MSFWEYTNQKLFAVWVLKAEASPGPIGVEKVLKFYMEIHLSFLHRLDLKAQ